MNGPSLVSMRPLLKRKSFSLGALLLFVVVAVGFGIHFNFFGRADVATLYVAPNGSDSNACTQSAPCLSFNQAYKMATSGTTVLVAAGTYSGQTINWDASKQAAGSNIVFQPAPGATVYLSGNITVLSSRVTFQNMIMADPANPANAAAKAQNVDPSLWPSKSDVNAYTYPLGTNPSSLNDVGNITFQGITARNFEIIGAHDVSVLKGSYGPSSACQTDPHAQPGLTQYGGGNNAIRAAYPTYPSSGPHTDPYNITVDGATIHNIMSYFTDATIGGHFVDGCHTEGIAVFAGTGNMKILNSKFYGNDVYDVFLQANAGAAKIGNVVMENNWFAQSTAQAGKGSGNNTVAFDGTNGEYSNSLIANNSINGSFGFDESGNNPNYTNFQVVGNIGSMPYFGDCFTDVTYKYNLWTNSSCGSGDKNLGNASTRVAGTVPFKTATNDATMDYSLTPGAAALNFVPTSAYPSGAVLANDIDYHCRPASGQSNLDAGASEMGSTGSCGDPGSSGGSGPTNTPPTASISSPANDATVSGTTTVTAAAAATTSGASISSVQFMVDGANVGSPDTSSPYSYSLDTTALGNGTHTLAVQATDSNNLSTTSAAVSVTVSNNVGGGGGCTTTVSTATALTSAVSSAASGATICVATGNYGAMTWTGGTGRTSKAIVKPASGTTVAFTGTLTINASEVEVQDISLAGQQYVVNAPAHDIQMTNVTTGRFELDSSGTSGVSNFTIKGGSIGPWHSYPDNRIASNNGTGSNQNIVIDGAKFHDFTIPSTSSQHFECLQVWSANGLVIKNSTFTNCSYFDIFIQKAAASPVPPTPTNVTIENNFLDCCTYSDTGAFTNYAIMLPTDHLEGAWNNITIRNNSGNSPYAIGWNANAATFSGDALENNIAPRIDSYLSGGTLPSGLGVNYNLWYAGSKIGTHDLSGVATGSLFTNFSAKDFHLIPGAAAIDKADPGSYPLTDIDGDKRPQGNAPDIGADETSGSAPVTSPTVPTGLHSTGTTQTSISLAWTASTDSGGPGLAGYHVYRNGALVGTVAGTGFTDTGLIAGTSYSYTLDAYDKSGNASSQSDAVAVSTAPAQPIINPPTNVQATATGPNAVALTWTASSNATHYYVVRRDSHNPAETIASLGSVTSYTDTTAIAATAYTYYIMGGDDNGNFSTPSNTVSVTTPALPDTTPPSVPTGVVAQAVSSVQVNVTWNPSTDSGSGVAGYNVYRSDKGSAPYAVVTSGTSWGESGLTPGASYTYTVSAYDAVGNLSSPSSPPTSVTMPATSGSVSMGSQTVKKHVDTIAPGSAKAFHATAKGTGSATKFQLYIDGKSKSTAVTVGIYQNSSQRTGKLLSLASSQLKAGAWNTISIPATALKDKQVYWVAVLNRGSGVLVVRDSTTGFADTLNANPNLTTLPVQWTPGTRFNNAPLSAYISN